MRRATILTATTALAVLLLPGVGWACGFLVAENGAIRLDRFTAAAVLEDDGTAHYVTSFSFQGSPESFGAVIPLPDVPTEVEKAPGWFLQRLVRETDPQPFRVALPLAAADESGAEVIATYEVDALDITVLRGGAVDVLEWALANGFDLGVADGRAADLTDTLAMLEWYAERSPIFAAIRFDNQRAREQELNSGEGIPVRFTFADQDQAWIPVKILTFDKPATETIVADLFLMTPGTPTILGGVVEGTEVVFQEAYDAGSALVADLTDDERAGWVPADFTLTRIDVRTEARLIDWDVAAAVDRRPTTAWAFGAAYAAAEAGDPYDGPSPFSADPAIARGELAADPGVPWVALFALVVAGLAGGALLRRRAGRTTPDRDARATSVR